MIKVLAIGAVAILAYVYVWPMLSGHAAKPFDPFAPGSLLGWATSGSNKVAIGIITDANGRPLT